MSITPGMALRAAYDLREAAQAAIIAHYTNTGSTLQRAHLDELKSRFEQAARALGYTLTPIPLAEADSGRASEIGGDIYQNMEA